MQIVRTFSDSGKSGLRIDGRDALKELIDVVQSGQAGFKVILVYDVSRWGRFQDADESAYYEYICKRAGISVQYCAEQFENDGSPVSTIVKGVKRAMAGEYSRELSAKVFKGQCKLVELGFRQGGPAGYGLRRLLIDQTGKPKTQLHDGEQKSLHRFGSLVRAYQLIGYTPERDFAFIETNRRLRRLHPDIVDSVIRALEQVGGRVARDGASELLRVNAMFSVSVVLSRCQKTAAGAFRWLVRLDEGLSPDLTIRLAMAKTRAVIKTAIKRAGRVSKKTPASFANLPGPFGAYEEPLVFEQAADITGIEFHAGETALEGYWLNLNVHFATHGAPEGKKWEIWPQEANVRIVSNTGGSPQVNLGAFRAPLTHSIRPAFHAHKSDSTMVPFMRRFSELEITAIEEWRAGQDLKLQVNIAGFGKQGPQTTWSYFRQHDTTVPRSKWMDMLAGVRFQDKVHVAVSARGDRRTEEGAKYLRTAIDHHARADYSNVAQTCRKAIEEIGTAGFGRKPPKEVKDFMLHQDPRKYTLEDRAAIVKMAAVLLMHAGAHAGEDERRWQRADAELALAMTAGLLRVAPSRLSTAEPEPKSTIPQPDE